MFSIFFKKLLYIVFLDTLYGATHLLQILRREKQIEKKRRGRPRNANLGNAKKLLSLKSYEETKSKGKRRMVAAKPLDKKRKINE